MASSKRSMACCNWPNAWPAASAPLAIFASWPCSKPVGCHSTCPNSYPLEIAKRPKSLFGRGPLPADIVEKKGRRLARAGRRPNKPHFDPREILRAHAVQREEHMEARALAAVADAIMIEVHN